MERTTKLDPLTGLSSGDWLHTERWPAALRSGRPLGVLFLGLDHQKLPTDPLGHHVGGEFEVLIHGFIEDPNRAAWSLLLRLSDRGVSASLGLAYTTVTEFVPAR